MAGTEPGARQVVVQLQQRWGGLPVYRRGATVVLDSAGQRVRSVRLFVADVTPEPPADDVGAEAAIAAARQALAGKAAVAEGEPGLARRILPGPPARRVWQVVLSTIVPPGRMSVFVDAQSGEPVWVRRDVVH